MVQLRPKRKWPSLIWSWAHGLDHRVEHLPNLSSSLLRDNRIKHQSSRFPLESLIIAFPQQGFASRLPSRRQGELVQRRAGRESHPVLLLTLTGKSSTTQAGHICHHIQFATSTLFRGDGGGDLSQNTTRAPEWRSPELVKLPGMAMKQLEHKVNVTVAISWPVQTMEALPFSTLAGPGPALSAGPRRLSKELGSAGEA